MLHCSFFGFEIVVAVSSSGIRTQKPDFCLSTSPLGTWTPVWSLGRAGTAPQWGPEGFCRAKESSRFLPTERSLGE